MARTAREALVAERLCRTFPAVSVCAAMLLMALPVPLALGAMPNLALLFTIIWASLQPRLMPVWLAFLLGLMFDLVAGQPLGHSALLFAAAVTAVQFADRRLERHRLALDWLFAAVLILAAAVLSWRICAFVGRPAALGPLLLQAATTILAYPPAFAVAARVQRRILEWAA